MDNLALRVRLLEEELPTKEVHRNYLLLELPLSGKSVKVFFSDSGFCYYLESRPEPLSEDELVLELKILDKSSPSPSVPEPPPKPFGTLVPNALISHLKKHHTYFSDDLCTLVKERDAFGRKKYGQPLMSEDGRDGVEDARQEAGDLLQYAFKVYLSGDKDGLEKIRRLVNGIQAVVEELSLSK